MILIMCAGPRGRDRMVVGFTATYVISAYGVSSNHDQGEMYNII